MENHFIQVVKLFIFVQFHDLIWAVTVAQFQAVAMLMPILFSHLEVTLQHNCNVSLIFFSSSSSSSGQVRARPSRTYGIIFVSRVNKII